MCGNKIETNVWYSYMNHSEYDLIISNVANRNSLITIVYILEKLNCATFKTHGGSAPLSAPSERQDLLTTAQ